MRRKNQKEERCYAHGNQECSPWLTLELGAVKTKAHFHSESTLSRYVSTGPR